MHYLKLEYTRSRRHEKDTSNQIDGWGTGTCRSAAYEHYAGTGTDYGAYAPAGQLDNLVSRIALYPDPLLVQIFAAAAFPINLPQPHKVHADHLIRRSRP
jgi:hypothetical protein